MRASSPKTILLLLAVLIAGGVIVAMTASPEPSLRVKVLDPRFHLISARMLQSTNDFLYLGNPLEGRVRDFLRSQVHLKVKPLGRMYKYGWFSDGPLLRGSNFLVMYYKWEATPTASNIWTSSAGNVFLKFVDRSGKSVPTTFVSALNGTNALAEWDLDPALGNLDHCVVRLVQLILPSGGAVSETNALFQAEVRLKK